MKKLLLLLFFITATQAQVIVLKHTAYEIHFDTKLKQPIFTHYILTVQHAKECKGSKIPRTTFHSDSLICGTCQISNKAYAKVSKIYDRGHLAPDDDFRWSKRTEREAMIYDNESFQVFQFNRGTWKSLEEYVRLLAVKYDVEVFTGVIYGSQIINSFAVPNYYWKLIKYNGITEAYKIPNIIPTSKNFSNFKVDNTELLNLIR